MWSVRLYLNNVMKTLYSCSVVQYINKMIRMIEKHIYGTLTGMTLHSGMYVDKV